MNKFKIISAFTLGTLLLYIVSPILSVQAASVTSFSDTLSTVTQSVVANHDITFTTPTGIAGGAVVTLTFGTGFSINGSLDYTDIDVLDDGVNVTLAASPVTTTWGAVRTSGTVITLTNGSSAVGAGSVVRVKIGTNATNQSTGVRQITNPTSGNNTVALTGNFGDTGTSTIPIIGNSEVSVSATVGQSLTFSISDNTIGFGTLSSSAVRYATGDTAGSGSDATAHNFIAGTNASAGYTVTVNGATLTSGGNTIDAIGSSNSASSAGTEQFGFRIDTPSGGTGVVDAPYAASGYAFDTAAFPDQVAHATGASANTTFPVHYIANIASATEAGDYTATLTYSATANF